MEDAAEQRQEALQQTHPVFIDWLLQQLSVFTVFTAWNANGGEKSLHLDSKVVAASLPPRCICSRDPY